MKRITHGRTPQVVVATHHVHGGASASEPCTFSDCPGGLAKRVPFFAGKKYANGRKAATLALAVALWLAGGGVAGAAELYIDANSASGTNHVAGDYPDGATVTVTDDKMTLNINGGTWSDWSSFNAGIKKPAGYTLNASNATFGYSGVTLYGASYIHTEDPGRELIENNAVVISDSTFTGKAKIYGAYGKYNDTTENIYNFLGGNTVTIAGSTAGGGAIFKDAADIYAAYDDTSKNRKTKINRATNNTVNLYGAAAMENVTLHGCNNEIKARRSGNELHLGGVRNDQTGYDPWQGYALDNANNVTDTVNNTVKKVDNFNKIMLHKVNWSTSTDMGKGIPVLHATNGFSYEKSTSLDGKVTLDISAMTFANTVPASGTMTLLSSGVENIFSKLNLTYKSGTSNATATLSSAAPGVIVQAGTPGTPDAANGVTIGYQTGARSVSLADSYKKVNYTIHNDKLVDAVTLGNIVWTTNGTARALTAGDYNFSAATINTTNLAFTNPEAVTGSMTLIAGATNLAAGTNIAHTQDFTKAANGATLSATLSGNVTRTANTLGYTATGTALTGVNLTNWNRTAAAVPTGWTSGLTANSITAADFTAPSATTDILTTDTADFFSDDYITGAMKYASTTFTNEAQGVTLTGGAASGVKASDDGKKLSYCVEGATGVTGISLGAMTWARDATATATTSRMWRR